MGRVIWQIRLKNKPYGERAVIGILLLKLPASSKSGARPGQRKLSRTFLLFQNFDLKALDTESILKVIPKKNKKKTYFLFKKKRVECFALHLTAPML